MTLSPPPYLPALHWLPDRFTILRLAPETRLSEIEENGVLAVLRTPLACTIVRADRPDSPSSQVGDRPDPPLSGSAGPDAAGAPALNSPPRPPHSPNPAAPPQTVSGPWRCFQVAGPLDHAMVGVLAGLSGVLASAEIPIFALSEFDTDYVLIPDGRREDCSRALANAGYLFDPAQE